MSQIAKIKSHIEEVEELIQQKKNRLKDEGNTYALKLSLKSLENQLKDLQVQLKSENELRNKEVIKLRFKGASAHFGNLPLDYVGGLSTAFSGAIFHTSKFLQFGNKGGKKIERIVKKTIDLRLEDIKKGSTIFYISGKTSPDLFGNSVIQEALSNTFYLLESDSPDEISNTISKVGANSIKYFSDFFRELNEDDLEVQINWRTPKNEAKSWEGTKEKILNLYNSLNQIKISEPIEIEFVGELVTISKKGYFEIITDEKEKFRGKFPNDLLPLMKSLNIEDWCEGKIIKTLIFNPLTEKEKPEFSLVEIRKIEKNTTDNNG